jgi:hypothetical protein
MSKANKPEDVWKKIDIKSPEECWEWKGTHLIHGYGLIRILGKRYLTHRLIYELTFGEIPKELYVCHKCDNPACCNPNHLFLGTQADNVKDMITKGRCKTKLTSTQIKEIRKLYQSGNYEQKDLIKMFKISQTNISFIINNKRWNNI